ncbi:hypothetical protein CTEN210_04443 [Chaetoceros tenuissimus]|uniref:ShKT domain-containing protein n=1 Tax=Chaetoceros tenuissimus TaxID=426638 RepID=A0AAD3CKW8_9STRA|nr:hypothetical protein CTEN210_04443 [Chaetoceros tenuissimus]
MISKANIVVILFVGLCFHVDAAQQCTSQGNCNAQHPEKKEKTIHNSYNHSIKSRVKEYPINEKDVKNTVTGKFEFEYIEPRCTDDISFREDGKEERTCQWVAQDPHHRCRKEDSNTGKKVFEFCRKTCNKCMCEDDERFMLNRDPTMNCEWIGKAAKNLCDVPQIREYCVQSCSAECCKDDPKFRFMSSRSVYSCAWVNSNNEKKTRQRCSVRAIAAACPESCRMCSLFKYSTN